MWDGLIVLLCLVYIQSECKPFRVGAHEPPHTQRDPQREPVEYSLHLVPSCWGSRCPCRFHVVCVNFLHNAKVLSGGIWALALSMT